MILHDNLANIKGECILKLQCQNENSAIVVRLKNGNSVFKTKIENSVNSWMILYSNDPRGQTCDISHIKELVISKGTVNFIILSNVKKSEIIQLYCLKNNTIIGKQEIASIVKKMEINCLFYLIIHSDVFRKKIFSKIEHFITDQHLSYQSQHLSTLIKFLNRKNTQIQNLIKSAFIETKIKFFLTADYRNPSFKPFNQNVLNKQLLKNTVYYDEHNTTIKKFKKKRFFFL
jgi:hypothetical protein